MFQRLKLLGARAVGAGLDRLVPGANNSDTSESFDPDGDLLTQSTADASQEAQMDFRADMEALPSEPSMVQSATTQAGRLLERLMGKPEPEAALQDETSVLVLNSAEHGVHDPMILANPSPAPMVEPAIVDAFDPANDALVVMVDPQDVSEDAPLEITVAPCGADALVLLDNRPVMRVIDGAQSVSADFVHLVESTLD